MMPMESQWKLNENVMVLVMTLQHRKLESQTEEQPDTLIVVLLLDQVLDLPQRDLHFHPSFVAEQVGGLLVNLNPAVEST
eukprot:1082922-Rhodomonas_salina.5